MIYFSLFFSLYKIYFLHNIDVDFDITNVRAVQIVVCEREAQQGNDRPLLLYGGKSEVKNGKFP